MKTERLVVFAKPPLPGKAKSRLAADIGDEHAASIAEAMLKDTIVLCERAAGGLPKAEPQLVLAYTEQKDSFDAPVGNNWRLLKQRGDDLGDRLENAALDLSAADDDSTVFIGMDSPHQPVKYLRDAFAILQNTDTVLGPCNDGGYYLVGVRGQWPDGIFKGVRWSTRHAFADTNSAFEDAGLTVNTLPQWYDIDNLQQLQRLRSELADEPAALLPNTRPALTKVFGDTGGQQ